VEGRWTGWWCETISLSMKRFASVTSGAGNAEINKTRSELKGLWRES
jgi:hypothetical protein